jgi:predicted SnoaL-like aldol condensation-catalyzing enzyme
LDSSNGEIVRSFFRRLWCDHDPSAIAEHLSPDVTMHGLSIEPMGRDQFAMFYQGMRQLVPDIRVDVTHVIEQDDWICLRGFASGTHRGSGNPVTVWGGGFARLENGLIRETHETWDMLAMMMQIGRVPRRVVEDLVPPPGIG